MFYFVAWQLMWFSWNLNRSSSRCCPTPHLVLIKSHFLLAQQSQNSLQILEGSFFFFFSFKGMNKYHQTSPQKRRESADGIMLAVAQLYGRKMAFVSMSLWPHASPFLLFPSGRKSTSSAVGTGHARLNTGDVVLVKQRAVGGKKSGEKYFTCKFVVTIWVWSTLANISVYLLWIRMGISLWTLWRCLFFYYWTMYKHKLDTDNVTFRIRV